MERLTTNFCIISKLIWERGLKVNARDWINHKKDFHHLIYHRNTLFKIGCIFFERKSARFQANYLIISLYQAKNRKLDSFRNRLLPQAFVLKTRILCVGKQITLESSQLVWLNARESCEFVWRVIHSEFSILCARPERSDPLIWIKLFFH